VAIDDVAMGFEDTPIDIDVAANDKHARTIAGTTPPTAGSVALLSGTLLRYTPPKDWAGYAAFDYTIDDGSGLTDTATVTITVTPTPDPPTATDDAYTTVGGGALVTGLPGVLANDGDEDGDTLTATASTPPTNGSVTLAADGSFVYTPNPLFTGTDSFEYTVGDGTGLTDTATVTVTVGGSPSQTSLFLGTSGASASDWDLTTSPPGSADPEPDHDGDADEGLTIKKGDEKLGNTDPEEFQHWSLTTPSDLVLNGPVSMRLWSTVGHFEANKAVDYSIWVRDCAADGTDCSTIASAVNVHVGRWNDRAGDWATRDIVVGSIDHTIAAGRMLRVRLMFDHRDVWVALSGTRPSQLLVTQ
jgi:hypothetical protein